MGNHDTFRVIFYRHNLAKTAVEANSQELAFIKARQQFREEFGVRKPRRIEVYQKKNNKFVQIGVAGGALE